MSAIFAKMKSFQRFMAISLWTQDLNWAYTRHSEDVLDLFWTSYVYSVDVCVQGVGQWFLYSVHFFKDYWPANYRKLVSFLLLISMVNWNVNPLSHLLIWITTCMLDFFILSKQVQIFGVRNTHMEEPYKGVLGYLVFSCGFQII